MDIDNKVLDKIKNKIIDKIKNQKIFLFAEMEDLLQSQIIMFVII